MEYEYFFFVWTEDYGFEPAIFVSEEHALRYIEMLSGMQAYREAQPQIRQITPDELTEATQLA